MRRIYPLALGSFALLLAASPARAWDPTGHKVVARIAWESMTPAARTRAIQILNAAPTSTGIPQLRPGPGPTRDRDFFVAVATWPDVIKSPGPGHSLNHPDWHFRDQFWEMVNGQPHDAGMAPNGFLVDRLRDFSDSVGNASIPAARRAVYLAWLLHLTGDVHQPLHDSSKLPPPVVGDSGGNSFKLPQPFRNLHAYWDGILTHNNPGVSVGTLAQRIRAQHPQAQFQLKPGDFQAWAAEGLDTSEHGVYDHVLPHQAPGAAYHQWATAKAESAVALAGYRLAALLNTRL